MFMFNESSLNLLNYFPIALILLLLIIYVKHLRHYPLFDILLAFNDLTYTWYPQNRYVFSSDEIDIQSIRCDTFKSTLSVPKKTDYKGSFSCYHHKSSHILTWVSVYWDHRWIYYNRFCIKGCCKNPID